MTDIPVMVITGTRKGIGRYLCEYYLERGYVVVGCSRGEKSITHAKYRHFGVDVADEKAVVKVFAEVRAAYRRLDVLLNNAGIASMNHSLLTPAKTVEQVLRTNVTGSFLFAREAAKLMKERPGGRIVNFGTVASRLRLQGEAIYAASKSAILSLTEIMARELAPLAITVNALCPTPVDTDLIRSVPKEKIEALLAQQAIPRLGEFRDISNAVDFFIQPESDFITGQVIYLGGV